jgi:hypothetical protein
MPVLASHFYFTNSLPTARLQCSGHVNVSWRGLTNFFRFKACHTKGSWNKEVFVSFWPFCSETEMAARWHQQNDLRQALLFGFIALYFYSYSDYSIWFSRSLSSRSCSQSQKKTQTAPIMLLWLHSQSDVMHFWPKVWVTNTLTQCIEKPQPAPAYYFWYTAAYRGCFLFTLSQKRIAYQLAI